MITSKELLKILTENNLNETCNKKNMSVMEENVAEKVADKVNQAAAKAGAPGSLTYIKDVCVEFIKGIPGATMNFFSQIMEYANKVKDVIMPYLSTVYGYFQNGFMYVINMLKGAEGDMRYTFWTKVSTMCSTIKNTIVSMLSSDGQFETAKLILAAVMLIIGSAGMYYIGTQDSISKLNKTMAVMESWTAKINTIGTTYKYLTEADAALAMDASAESSMVSDLFNSIYSYIGKFLAALVPAIEKIFTSKEGIGFSIITLCGIYMSYIWYNGSQAQYGEKAGEFGDAHEARVPGGKMSDKFTSQHNNRELAAYEASVRAEGEKMLTKNPKDNVDYTRNNAINKSVEHTISKAKAAGKPPENWRDRVKKDSIQSIKANLIKHYA